MKFMLTGTCDKDELAVALRVANRPGVAVTVDTEEEIAVTSYILTIEFLFWSLSAIFIFRS